jgi:aryl-alcohol dehydrogenase-like predicted oxidoreductase
MIPKISLAGVEVSRLAVGTVPMNPDRYDDQAPVFDRFLELGGNAIDLGWNYYGGGCTRMVGRWMRERGCRNQCVLMTKVCHPFREESQRVTPAHLRSDVEDELSRAEVDHLEFASFHRDNPEEPVEGLIAELAKLKEEGKVGAWGASNWSLSRIEEFNQKAQEMGVPGFAFNNPQLFLGEVNEAMWGGCVTLDKDGVEWHRSTGMPLASWSSAGGGFYAGIETEDIIRVYHNPANLARRERARGWAAERRASPVQAALAWVLAQDFPTIAVIGPDRIDHLEESAGACALAMTAEERDWLWSGG